MHVTRPVNRLVRDSHSVPFDVESKDSPKSRCAYPRLAHRLSLCTTQSQSLKTGGMFNMERPNN